MITRLRLGVLLLVSLLVLAGCGTEATTVPIVPTATTAPVETAPTATTAAPADTPTTASVDTPTVAAEVTAATTPGGGGAMDISVSNFAVWQNFMPGTGSG